MTFTKFRIKIEFATYIGVSESTVYRRLKQANYQVKRGLLSPKIQKEIYNILNDEPKSNELNITFDNTDVK
ncbi:MAG: hypothetical protein HC803_01635 [Saprospiraceae bacterium]|nr:hypothetical protein [Saprospiraceae bacterium]